MTESLMKPARKFVIVCLSVLELVVSGEGASSHPLELQESIVPERDLPPRNFNPHPYVSRGVASVLSNFDHPYAGVASKRSGYFRNGPNTRNLWQLDNDPAGRMSINSLANFARRFLRLKPNLKLIGVYNDKKFGAFHTNDAIIEETPFPESLKFFPIRNNYYYFFNDNNNPGGIGDEIIDYRGSQSGRNNNDQGQLAFGPKFVIGNDDGCCSDGYDGDGTRGRIRRPPFAFKDQRDKLYLGKTLNLASVQQSSLNEDALSLGDTNDNLSQGLFYVSRDDEDGGVSGAFNYSGQDQDWVFTDASRSRIEAYNKLLLNFIITNSKYRVSSNDELHLESNNRSYVKRVY